MLKFMGANTSLSVHQAKELIEVSTGLSDQPISMVVYLLYITLLVSFAG